MSYQFTLFHIRFNFVLFSFHDYFKYNFFYIDLVSDCSCIVSGINFLSYFRSGIVSNMCQTLFFCVSKLCFFVSNIKKCICKIRILYDKIYLVRGMPLKPLLMSYNAPKCPKTVLKQLLALNYIYAIKCHKTQNTRF